MLDARWSRFRGIGDSDGRGFWAKACHCARPISPTFLNGLTAFTLDPGAGPELDDFLLFALELLSRHYRQSCAGLIESEMARIVALVEAFEVRDTCEILTGHLMASMRRLVFTYIHGPFLGRPMDWRSCASGPHSGRNARWRVRYWTQEDPATRPPGRSSSPGRTSIEIGATPFTAVGRPWVAVGKPEAVVLSISRHGIEKKAHRGGSDRHRTKT
jgi:hypothetical protein